MSGIQGAWEKINRGKLKIFLLFLLCSFLAWSISKLSEVYESTTRFKVVYTNMPDSLLTKNEGAPQLLAKIRASGFQFLSYALDAKTIEVSLANVLEQDGRFFLTANTLENQIDRQLPNRVNLLGVTEPVYYTDVFLVANKKVPVSPQLDLKLAQNHLLKEPVLVSPDSVQLKGPKQLLDNLDFIKTIDVELTDVETSFSRSVPLQALDSLGSDILIDATSVTISGTVIRFSEKQFDIPIKALNVPDGYQLKMFPNHVELICKAGEERLRTMSAEEFEAVVNFKDVVDEKYLFVQLQQVPETIFSVRLLQNRIEFVLEKI